MPAISFQQGVALALGAYIDPANSANNKRFTLVATSNYNNNGVFGINPKRTIVDNRLSALFHGRNPSFGDVGNLNFEENTAGPALGDLPDQPYTPASTSVNVTDIELTGYDLVFTGYNATEKQLTYRSGGDIVGNGTVSKIERNYHRTGLAIWNKLKK